MLMMVALSRGRGSKPDRGYMAPSPRGSPSHEGVDRNIVVENRGRALHKSPSHEGVDRNTSMASSVLRTSVALSRGRGSKPVHPSGDDRFCEVALSRGRGSKPARGGQSTAVRRSPSHEGVDRNLEYLRWWARIALSPSHEGVDRNLNSDGSPSPDGGRPLTRAWIETLILEDLNRTGPMSPSHEGVDRNTNKRDELRK